MNPNSISNNIYLKYYTKKELGFFVNLNISMRKVSAIVIMALQSFLNGGRDDCERGRFYDFMTG